MIVTIILPFESIKLNEKQLEISLTFEYLLIARSNTIKKMEEEHGSY